MKLLKLLVLNTTICLAVIVIVHVHGIIRERKALLEGLISLEVKLSSFIELNSEYLGTTSTNFNLHQQDSSSNWFVEVRYHSFDEVENVTCLCRGNIGNSSSFTSLPQSQSFPTSLLLSKEINRLQSQLHHPQSYLINILVHLIGNSTSELEREILHYIEQDYLFTLLKRSHSDLTLKIVLIPYDAQPDKSYLEGLFKEANGMSRVDRGSSIHFHFRAIVDHSASRTADSMPSPLIPIIQSKNDLAEFIRRIGENVLSSLGGPSLTVLLNAAVAKSLQQKEDKLRNEWALIHDGCGDYLLALQKKLTTLKQLMKVEQSSQSLRLIVSDMKEIPFYLDLITLIEDNLSINTTIPDIKLLLSKSVYIQDQRDFVALLERVVRVLMKWQSWYSLHLTNITTYQQYLVIYGTFFLPLLVPLFRVVTVLFFKRTSS